MTGQQFEAAKHPRGTRGRFTETHRADPGAGVLGKARCQVDGRDEYTGNPVKPWSQVHPDYRHVRDDGTRVVLANIDGIGTCTVPWRGPECRCMPEDPHDGLGERVVTHSMSCPQHPEHDN